METVDELRNRLEEVEALLKLLQIGVKKDLAVAPLLGYIYDKVYNTINEMDEIIL